MTKPCVTPVKTPGGSASTVCPICQCECITTRHDRFRDGRARDALRRFADSVFEYRPGDCELAHALREQAEYPRIYAITMEDGVQVSSEIEPFDHAVEAA